MWANEVEEQESIMYGYGRHHRARVPSRAVFEGGSMADAANVVRAFLVLLCLLLLNAV
jgi:hypothetical protein